MTEPKNQSADFVGDTILEVVRDFPAWANVAKITKLAPSMCRSLRNQTKLPWKHIEINSEYWISKSYESIPRRKKPVAICNNQKTNATNARLCPRKMRDTGNVTTSCLSKNWNYKVKIARNVWDWTKQQMQIIRMDATEFKFWWRKDFKTYERSTKV